MSRLYEPTNRSFNAYGKLGTLGSARFWFRGIRKMPKIGQVVYVRQYPFNGYQPWQRARVDDVLVSDTQVFIRMSK